MTMTSSDNFLEAVRLEGTAFGPGFSFSAPPSGVPEPANAFLLAGGLGLLWAGRRKFARR